MTEKLERIEELPFGEEPLPGFDVGREPVVRRPEKVDRYVVVRVIREKRGNALLEWDDDLDHVQRCFLPLALVEMAGVGERVSVRESLLQKGAPFGDDLTPHLRVETPTPEALQDALRKRGVWGGEDVMKHPNTVRSVLQAQYQLDVVTIQNRVRLVM